MKRRSFLGIIIGLFLVPKSHKEDPPKITRVTFNGQTYDLVDTPIVARPRKLKARWTIEHAADLEAHHIHGMSAAEDSIAAEFLKLKSEYPWMFHS